jgi:3-oxoadipate CoA-transferase beta subunit
VIARRSREEMARRVASDIPGGSYVNLGIGLPTLVAAHWKPEHDIFGHSENGILGMRSLNADEQPDDDLINAGKQHIALIPGGAFFHHADSFAMMRGGHLDYSVLGAYQVSAFGDIANWSLGKPGVAAAVGGAMDLVVGAKHVYVLMAHTGPDGKSRVVKECSLPLTGQRCVDRIYTDLATIDVGPDGLSVIDMVDGLSASELQSLTDAPLRFA